MSNTITNIVSQPNEAAFTGISQQFIGVLGVSNAQGHAGIAGFHDEGNGVGVYGRSMKAEGVYGETRSENLAAIAAFMLNPKGIGAALHAENHGQGVGVFAKGGRLAALFEGNVEVTGLLKLNGIDIIGFIADLQGRISILESNVATLSAR